MKEIVIISGKGGTGKTSLTASFALLAQNAVLADCDVDAADLHLILTPTVQEHHDFWSGHEAEIDVTLCTTCGACLNLCRFEAIKESNGRFHIDPTACEGCGVCARFCPKGAVKLKERLCGAWMISDTRAGPMVHARLGIAAENSGRLVSTVRQEARELAKKTGRDLILIDGPPGIGCPVIASITGATAVIIVTEPSLSGEHDLMRALELTQHFKIPAFVCVNKWDIDSDRASQIEAQATTNGGIILGRIRYDKGVTEAQKQVKAVIEIDTPCSMDIRNLWDNLQQYLDKEPAP
ncbi:MAG: (4Fe-4S)-binding protein [Proteobacteria bacterium]|jgi:MinD superfamily P-loop ATPase|nr:ATP-binding protein [Alphaproteobacteria bacterium]NCC04137.1 (4Fe-4S)-binding protein [Pseudomonadota bacterium]